MPLLSGGYAYSAWLIIACHVFASIFGTRAALVRASFAIQTGLGSIRGRNALSGLLSFFRTVGHKTSSRLVAGDAREA
jgi:hypothetical protein